MSTERPFVVTPKFVLGVFVLIAGILLTLDSLNLVDTSRYFRFWPAVLIGVGAVVFTQARGGHDRGKGALIVLAGLVASVALLTGRTGATDDYFAIYK